MLKGDRMTENNTIFGRILRGEIPATKVYEDDRAIAIRDVNPQAPTHVLVIPGEWITGIAAAKLGDEALVGHLLWVAAEVARREGIAESGYRLVINQGPHGQQSVSHLHIHSI